MSERKSGYEFMSRETRAMQDDDATGPAVLWLLDGEALWGKLGCASCHGDAKASMKGVAARYPALVDGKLVNLEQQIAAQGRPRARLREPRSSRPYRLRRAPVAGNGNSSR